MLISTALASIAISTLSRLAVVVSFSKERVESAVTEQGKFAEELVVDTVVKDILLNPSSQILTLPNGYVPSREGNKLHDLFFSAIKDSAKVRIARLAVQAHLGTYV